jgi:hypothetical protein
MNKESLPKNPSPFNVLSCQTMITRHLSITNRSEKSNVEEIAIITLVESDNN